MATAATALPDVLERARDEERQRALRELLGRPLLDGRHPAFALVRRHQGWLREWLNRETGWHLQVESEFARLHKRPADTDDPTRPAVTGTGAARMAFSQRRYALFCLILADLERGDAQITLGRLGEGLVNAAADPTLEAAGLRFALDHRDERRDLVAVVRLLLEYGVLGRVAGDEDAFVRQGPESDVLYDVNRRVMAALLVTVRGPSLVELDGPVANLDQRLEAMNEQFVPDTPEGRNRALRQALTARLLDDPVVYWADLPEDARQYLFNQRSAISRRIEEATGLVPEIRAEGMAMVDPQQALSDRHMPAEGTEGHATLLVASHLAAMEPDTPVSLDTLAEDIAAVRQDYRRYWRKAALEPGTEWALARQAVKQLRGLRLVTVDDAGAIRALPALARFAVEGPRLPEDQQTDLTWMNDS